MSQPHDPPTPVGIGLVRREGCYLVRRRPAGTVYAGYWEFPGGKCEPEETPAQATARECLEEIGLPVVVGALRRVTTHRYPHGLVKLHFYDCTTDDPVAVPAAGSGFEWVPVNRLASLRFPEANEAVLQDLCRENPRTG